MTETSPQKKNMYYYKSLPEIRQLLETNGLETQDVDFTKKTVLLPVTINKEPIPTWLKERLSKPKSNITIETGIMSEVVTCSGIKAKPKPDGKFSYQMTFNLNEESELYKTLSLVEERITLLFREFISEKIKYIMEANEKAKIVNDEDEKDPIKKKFRDNYMKENYPNYQFVFDTNLQKLKSLHDDQNLLRPIIWKFTDEYGAKKRLVRFNFFFPKEEVENSQKGLNKQEPQGKGTIFKKKRIRPDGSVYYVQVEDLEDLIVKDDPNGAYNAEETSKFILTVENLKFNIPGISQLTNQEQPFGIRKCNLSAVTVREISIKPKMEKVKFKDLIDFPAQVDSKTDKDIFGNPSVVESDGNFNENFETQQKEGTIFIPPDVEDPPVEVNIGEKSSIGKKRKMERSDESPKKKQKST